MPDKPVFTKLEPAEVSRTYHFPDDKTFTVCKVSSESCRVYLRP